MNSGAQFSLSAILGAALVMAGTLPEPASAQDACKNERVTARSEGRIRGEGFATNEAKQRWEKAAEERFGKPYGTWASAKDANVECESVKSKRLGLPAVICTAYGRPCALAAAAPKAGTVVESDRRRGGERARDEPRRIVEGEGRRRHADRAYEREMAYQNRLAAERDRAQTRAYEREMAYQRHMEERRRRAERY
jgi:hypothetical protein